MIDIQPPPSTLSMSRAVAFDRSLPVFAPQLHQPITPLPLPYPHSANNLTSSTSTRPTLPIFTPQLTPPSEMNVAFDQGRMTTHHGMPHSNKDASGHVYQHGQHHHHHQAAMAQHKSAIPALNGASKPSHSPSSQRSSVAAEGRSSRRAAETNVAPPSRVPDTVRAPQSGIAQLAAEVTCLFWFEESSTLDRIESLPSPPPPAAISPLCVDAIPSVGFRKWVSTILSTTQVTQNVILLALMFIWRLKKFNPNVKGKPGSEFRLLTVALMLGNKFLDDNTYTNKTWAEVSAISVQEVHIMEVEFLSNMRYSLFTTEAEWMRWHVTLGKLGTYIDASTRMAHEQAARQATLSTPTLQIPPSLPSPPTSHHASSPFALANSPLNATRTNTPLLLPQISSTTVSPIGPLPEINLRPTARKRSYDEQSEEPPAKRLSRIATQPVYPTASMASLHLPTPQSNVQGQRLPLPALTIPSLSNSVPPVQVSGPQLPPPNRAMSMVYPSASQATPLPINLPTMVPTNLSPYPISGTSSPMSATFGQAHNRSPSYFLQQRSSPYRPVRQPHVLLAPPPSAPVSRDIPYTHMQYHPLGRQTERHTGQLPYMHHEAWPQSHQLNQWPVHTPR